MLTTDCRPSARLSPLTSDRSECKATSRPSGCVQLNSAPYFLIAAVLPGDALLTRYCPSAYSAFATHVLSLGLGAREFVHTRQDLPKRAEQTHLQAARRIEQSVVRSAALAAPMSSLGALQLPTPGGRVHCSRRRIVCITGNALQSTVPASDSVLGPRPSATPAERAPRNALV